MKVPSGSRTNQYRTISPRTTGGRPSVYLTHPAGVPVWVREPPLRLSSVCENYSDISVYTGRRG
jgi:hypothetical protein